MILTPGGEILTNNHVIAGCDLGDGHAVRSDRRRLPAHVVGTDPSEDLALIQIDHASNLPTVTFADSSQTRVGDTVLAIGNALALAGGPSVTEGIVSAENRSLTAENDSGQTENLTGLLQTDAAINPGNSGGPLVNSDGEVIGMNTAVASDTTGNAPTQNIGFAITVDSVKPLLAKLRLGGTGGAGSSPPQLSPADNSGVHRGDGRSGHAGASAAGRSHAVLGGTGHLGGAGQPGPESALQVKDVIVSFNGTSHPQSRGSDGGHPSSEARRPRHHRRLRGSRLISVALTLGARPLDG